MPDQESGTGPGSEPEVAGATRRGMLRGAAGLSVAGLTAGLLLDRTAVSASAATAAAREPEHVQAPVHDEPLVVHVHDARTGVVDLFTGTRHVRFTDPQLAARLARAAR